MLLVVDVYEQLVSNLKAEWIFQSTLILTPPPSWWHSQKSIFAYCRGICPLSSQPITNRDWLLRILRMLRFTPFPSARRRGRHQRTAQRKKLKHQLICFFALCSQTSLRHNAKNKRCRYRHLFTSFVLWVEDGTSILYLKTFLQVFTDHSAHFFYLYGLI